MSKKIIKIWSLALTVMLLGSMMVFAVPAVPVSADVGYQQFVPQTLPTGDKMVVVNGSDVSEIAQSSDGRVIYVVNGETAAFNVYRSTDGGTTFTAVGVPAPAAVALRNVAVAPDNSDVVAVSDGTDVWISTNGGSTFTLLARPSVVAAVVDLAVGPARTGTMLGREYAVAVSNPAAGAVAAPNGDVLIIGGATAAWATAVVGITGTRDYVAVKFTPNFVGDRCLVVIGAIVAPGIGPPIVGTALQVLNTATLAIVQTTVLIPMANAPPTTTDFGGAAPGAASIIRGDIALPSDYDATTASGRRCYASQASNGNQADNDVYRIDDNQSRALGAVTNQPVNSVSYAGTVDSGTLFEGRRDIVEVKYTTNPTTATPSWTTSKKVLPDPPAINIHTNAIVQVAADFAKSNKVYLGQSGPESAFSVSTNGGVTFNNKAFIDQGGDTICALVTTAMTGAAGTYTVTYTNESGVAGQVSGQFVVTAAPVGTRVVIPLVATDTGVIQVTGVNIVAAAATGIFNIVGDGTGATTNGFLFATYNVTGPVFTGFGLTTLNNVINIDSDSPTPDGKAMFIATRKPSTGIFSLWKSAAPTTAESWTRIYATAQTPLVAGPPANLDAPAPWGAGRASVALSPDWATTSTMFIYEMWNTAGTGSAIWRSTDGGDIWSKRNAPTANFLINASVRQDANITFVGDNNGVLYKSTTGGWTWGDPIQPNVGSIQHLAVPKPDALLVGGIGNIGYSVDGGTTFTTIMGIAGEPYRLANDPGFATNKTFYCAVRSTLPPTAQLAPPAAAPAAAAAPFLGQAYRYTIDKDTALLPLTPPSGAGIFTNTQGLMIRGGVLYVAYALVIDRTLRPLETAGTQEWDTMNVGPITAACNVHIAAAPTNTVYSKAATGAILWAYYDYVAGAKPVIKSPADKYSVTIDPVTGRADLITINLEPMGTTTGLVDNYQMAIYEKPAGWDARVESPITLGPPVTAIRVSNPAMPSIIMGDPTAAPVALAGGFQWPLKASTTYVYRIRAINEVSVDAVKSPWSDERSVNVGAGIRLTAPYEGPQLLGPTGGQINVPITTGFTWSPSYGATKYKYTLATDAGLTKKVAEATVATTSFQPDKPLDNATTYFWSVQPIEPTAGPTVVGTFTTVAKPAPPAPTPVITVAPAPPAPPPIITIPPAPAPVYTAPAYIWAIIVIGAILVIAVIVLIARTRRPM